MSVVSLPDTNLRVLEHLHIYRFLTVPQLLRLGIAEHKESVYRVMKRFKDKSRKLVDRKDFGFIPGIGKLPSIYYLTRYGAALLAELYRCDLNHISYPKGVHLFNRDYTHRVYTIDFHIALRRWSQQTGAEVAFFDTYFERTGVRSGGNISRKMRLKTQIALEDTFFIPDVIYSVINAAGQRHLTAVEIHNGRDTKRLLNQIAQHFAALENGAISDHYELTVASTIQCVFEHERTMHNTIANLRKQPDINSFKSYISFNTIDNIRHDYQAGWQSF